MNPNSSPGIGTTKSASPRKVLASTEGALFLPSGKRIDGSESRDPANTGDVDVLRAGLLMGKCSANGLFAPSILGVLSSAAVFDAATLTVPTAVSTEVLRRIGAGGVFRLVGPRVAGGPVRTRKCSLSSSAAGTITLAANAAVAEVQTLTLDALMTAGTFTLSYKGYTTAAIAFDATVAEITAALELLPSVNSGDITMQAAHEPDTELTCTWTFKDTLGNVPMLSMDISNATGPTSATWVETTPGELVAYATPGTKEVQTITNADGTDAGTFCLKWGDQVTTALTYDDTAADIEAALEALSSCGTDEIKVTGDAGGPWTLTFQGALDGSQPLIEVVNDLTNDGGVWEGGVVVARSVAGDGGAFIAGSLIMPDDGSEVPLTVLTDEYGIKVTDDDNTTNLDVELAKVLVGGQIKANQIINYPADAALQRWLKDQMNAISAGRFVFDDDYGLL